MKWFARYIISTIIIIAIVYSHAGYSQTALSGQSQYYASNVKRVDSINKFIRTFCDSIKPLKVDDKVIKHDQKNILYVNKLFNSNSTYKDFAQGAKKNDLVQTNALHAGLTGFNEYKFYPPNGYLAISILLTVINDQIIYKKITIESPTKRKCTNNEVIPFFDFLYLKKEILPVINFPINDCANCDSLTVDTLYQSLLNEVALTYPAYKFVSNGTTDQVKSLLFKNTYLQISAYNNKVAPDIFLQLIKLKEYDAVKSLLYSPNELMAVNAYETLVYLKSKVELEIDPPMAAKMKEILNSNIEIPVFCGRDCKPTNFSYNTLKIKEKDILDKYQTALE